MFNVADSRLAATEAKFPRVILFCLLLYATITACFMGYSRPQIRRYFVASTLQFALLALAIGLIVDLDRARVGLVTVSQAPLYRAVSTIHQAEALRSPRQWGTPRVTP